MVNTRWILQPFYACALTGMYLRSFLVAEWCPLFADISLAVILEWENRSWSL